MKAKRLNLSLFLPLTSDRIRNYDDSFDLHFRALQSMKKNSPSHLFEWGSVRTQQYSSAWRSGYILWIYPPNFFLNWPIQQRKNTALCYLYIAQSSAVISKATLTYVVHTRNGQQYLHTSLLLLHFRKYSTITTIICTIISPNHLHYVHLRSPVPL